MAWHGGSMPRSFRSGLGYTDFIPNVWGGGMLLWILGSFVVSEAVIGITLTALLLLGRTDPLFVVDTLSVIGFAIFAVGFLPLLSKLRHLALEEPAIENKPDEGSTFRRNAGLRLCTFAERFGHLLRAILIGGIVVGTGLGLFYFSGSS